MATYRLIKPEDLRRMRKNTGLTQKELAKKAGVSQSLIARIETKSVDPRLSTLQKIVDALLIEVEGGLAGDIMKSPVITVDVKDQVRDVVKLMRKNGISQIPVLRDTIIVGSIQESTILERFALTKDFKEIFDLTVDRIMEDPFPIVRDNDDVNEVIDLLFKGYPAILVRSGDKLIGIITKIDVILSAIPVISES